MKETAPPPDKMPKSQRPRRHDDSWTFLQGIYPGLKSADAESDRQRVSKRRGKQIGPEYWLG